MKIFKFGEIDINFDPNNGLFTDKKCVLKLKTKGGILLTDKTMEESQLTATVAMVLAVGDDAYQDKEKFPNGPWCEAGNYVCYGKHTGQKFFYKGIKLLLFVFLNIKMKINKKAKKIIPIFKL